MEKMEILQCPNSITIEAFRKGIKRDIGLFVELTNILLMCFMKRHKIFVNFEREMTPTKASISKATDKPNPSKDGERKPFVDKRLNLSHFEPILTLRGRLGT